MTKNCPSRTPRSTRGIVGMRGALAVATALAGGSAAFLAMPGMALAQTVMIAPKGSHRAPSETPPVYAGADIGQDAPNALSTPPILRNPVSLTPDSAQIAAPAAAPAPVAAPVEVTPPPAPIAAAEPAPVAPPITTPVQSVRTRPAVSVAAAAPRETDADALNSDEFSRLERAGQPSTRNRPTVSAGDSPRYLDTRPQSAARYADVLPPEQRYQPRYRDPQDRYRPPTRLADNSPTPGDDGPLVSPSRASFASSDRQVPPQQARSSVYVPSGAVAYSGSSGTLPVANAGGYDPVTQEIDRSIAQLQSSLAPSLMATAEFSGHNGQSGLSRLSGLMVPIEASFSPGGTGVVKITVTPTQLQAGNLGNSLYSYPTFGTMAFGVTAPSVTAGTYTPISYTGKVPSAQTATGAAIDLSYTLGSITADVGSTPIGFREQNIVGGLVWTPSLSDTTNLRITGERRALRESFLSYSGAVDPYSGRHWGGVVRDTARFGIETRQGLWNIYGLVGGGYYTGDHVQTNNMYEAAVGATYPVFRFKGEELRLGVDLHYTSFYRNLRYFTYGQGGYFSPQRDIAFMVPVTYHNQISRDLSYDLRGAVGYQLFGEASSQYFPDDAALQSKLVASTAYAGLPTFYPGQRASGITGGFGGQLDYKINRNFSIGARAAYDQSGIYQEYGGAIYAKYIFNGWYGQ